MQIPASFDAHRARGEDWARWLDALPRLVADLLEEWTLRPDGEPAHGYGALVLSVRTAGGRPAVLKVGWPHEEAEHEHVALKQWAGRGAVELLRADPGRHALLLERLDPQDLSELWDLEACEVVAGLYGRLHRPAPPQLRRLSGYVARWTEALAVRRSSGVPPRLRQQAVALGRHLAADPDTDGITIHADLHYENVLRNPDPDPARGPWLAIDPKPVSGDPHYELAPMLWNRFEELTGDVRRGVVARFHTLVDAAGLDEDRARGWVVFRMVLNASEGDLDPTVCVSVAKAVQP